MWQRSQLLHPATIIASIALFVSLGGVTYAAATIGTKQLKTGAVTRAKIKNRAVSASKLANNAVVTEKLATGAVTPTKLRTGAVTAGKLADGAIQTSNLQNGAVTESKLGSGAVTASKLGGGAVGTAAIADGAITAGKLAPGVAVAGTGSSSTFFKQLTNGQSLTLATIQGFGTLSTTCAAGNADSKFTSTASEPVTARRVAVRDVANPSVATSAVATGASVTVANAAGDQQVTWSLAFTDAGGTAHVATVLVSNVFDGTSCQVIGQIQTTG